MYGNQRKEEKLDVNKESPKRVLCVGSCILNIFHVCEGMPTDGHVRAFKSYWQRGGNASRSCTVLQLLGTCSEYFGVLSGRTAYKCLLQDFEEHGVIIENCPQLDIHQPYSSIFLRQYGKENIIVRSDTKPPAPTYSDFKERIKLTNYKWIHFEGRDPLETTPMINMIRQYNKENAEHITISVELAKPTRDILTLAMRADLVFVGRQFASHIGWKSPKETVFSLRELLSILQLREDKEDSELDLCFYNSHLICPWADDGVHVLTAEYEYYHIPPPAPVQVLDTVGAGATFVAAVVHSLISRNMAIREAVEFGIRLAAFKTQYRGLECIKNYTIPSGEAEKKAVVRFEGNGTEENSFSRKFY
uniref:PfkB domain-containing protein n=1 Tax=Glossina austeni TaxID=7395 RepID=A0A1A9VET3_GLOAU